MNLRQLEYFVCVAETLSFTKTAETFYISQTAVTQQIRALEEQLGVTLFNRTKRSVKLTPAGSIFLGEARAILNRMDSAVEKARQAANGFTGSLKLGIIQGYDNPYLPDVIHNFCAAYPNVSLQFTETNTETLYKMLLEKTLDLTLNVVFPFTHLDVLGLESKLICNYPLMVLMPADHPLAFRSQLDLSELKNEDFIFTGLWGIEEQFGQFESTMSHFSKAGFTPKFTHHSEHFNITALMVCAGMGIAIVPSYAAFSCRSAHNLVIIPLDEKSDRIDIAAIYNPHAENPMIQKFLEFV